MDGNKRRQRIALLNGGDSSEREVSLASGQEAARALESAGYEAVVFDPAEGSLESVNWSCVDACFIALHGGAGEDGRVQAELERIGVPYTGSGPTACRLAMSKSAAKRRFIRRSVPTPPFVSVSGSVCVGEAERILSSVGFPLVIKPDSQGSSLGVTIAADASGLGYALAAAAKYDSQLVAEPLVYGREFTVALLGRRTLPLIEIRADQAIFDYKAKYSAPKKQHSFANDLPHGIETSLYRAAVSAAEAIGTAGLVRVDLILDRENQPWVLEVNTIPGLTSHSLAPMAAHEAGMDMPALMDWMIQDAVARSGGLVGVGLSR